jgi:Golgi nucleoside diphosphatase
MKRAASDPGIRQRTTHGMMIDAGSSGSRLHLFEFGPRVLSDKQDVEDAISGRKISFPSSNSRWTDRLRPGIASFASIPDDKSLDAAIFDYLSPLLDFAKTILQDKEEIMGEFPIFFRATAGMRILEKNDRNRVLSSVRRLFSDNTFCPFHFENEFARVLSGEEEAIFGWTGINFAMGNLVEQSEGAGTVINPKLTYGALDMGGASTQIAFYEPDEDIMANLFKLQIGQAKHWNLYAHSFLFFGLNEARNRFQAKLVAKADMKTRLIIGVQNPCLPGGSSEQVRLSIHIDDNGLETFDPGIGVSQNAFYQAMLKNDEQTGNFKDCLAHTNEILNLEANSWCNFAHQGECSFNGVSMPYLPPQSEDGNGEFLAFSNYHHIWDFLGLNRRASMQELYDATNKICSVSRNELVEYNKNHANVPDEEINDYCFRSSYAYNILSNGYGFKRDDYITATDVVNGQKVSWAVGAILYEINTFPWVIDSTDSLKDDHSHLQMITAFFFLLLGVSVLLSKIRRQNRQEYYEPLKEAKM